MTLRNIPDTLRIREFIDKAEKKLSAVVVGGGYIGVEMAENLKEAGCDVTIVELSDHLIAPLDDDMAAEVHNYIDKMGVKLVLKNGVSPLKTPRRLVVQLKRAAQADISSWRSVSSPTVTWQKPQGWSWASEGASPSTEACKPPTRISMPSAMPLKSSITCRANRPSFPSRGLPTSRAELRLTMFSA